LHVRLSLYRRLSELEDNAAGNAFAAEMIDRFGPLPREVDYLLQVMSIKRLARRAKVAKIDAGPKGAVFTFRHADIQDPAAILGALQTRPNWRLRPDQPILVPAHLTDPKVRLDTVEQTLKVLAKN